MTAITKKKLENKDTPQPGNGENALFLGAILNHTAEGFITIGVDGTITTFNPAAEKMFGYSADEMIGANLSVLMEDTDDKAHGGHVRNYVETGMAKILEIGTREVRVTRKDGNVFPIELNISEFFLGDERQFIGTMRDISERKAVEDALNQNREELERQVVELRDQEERLEAQAMEMVELAEGATVMRDELDALNKQKDKFFSIIAHDLKSPFNALLGFSGILQSQGADMERDQVVEYGGLINQSAAQAYALLVDLLDWARLQMGRMDFEPQFLDLSDEADECLSLLKSVALVKNIALKSEIETGQMVDADPHMLATILRNLIGNAIKFTPDGGEVTVTAEPSGHWTEVAVADTGVGIPAEKIKKLFHIEEKTTTKGTGGETGTGLGLHLCKELIERHAGEISIDSTEGGGTTFRFTLPAA